MRRILCICTLLFPLPLFATSFSFSLPLNKVHLSYRAVVIQNITANTQELNQLLINKAPEGVELCTPSSDCLLSYQSTCQQNLVLIPHASCTLWFHAKRQTDFASKAQDIITITVADKQQQISQQKFQLSIEQQLFAGGGFSKPAENIARWNGRQWFPVGGGLIGGSVHSLVEYAGDIIASGDFYQAGDVLVNFIARWNGERWDAVVDGVGDPGPSALTVYADSLFVGGGFDHVNGYIDAHYLASFYDERWSGFETQLDMPIMALQSDKQHLYVGGYFTEPVNHIGLWRYDHMEALGAGLDDTVLAMAITVDGTLYAGGVFKGNSGTTLDHIARWDGREWLPLAQGLNETVAALAAHDNTIYVGGNFSKAGSQIMNHIARWDGRKWQALAGGVSNEKAPQYTTVYGIDSSGDDVFVAGYFTLAHNTNGNIKANYIARWQPSTNTWFSLGEGLNGAAYSVLTVPVLKLSLIK